MKKPKEEFLTPIKPRIGHHHFRVAIFGSARIRPNDGHYKKIYRLAKLIAKEGFDIITGGGPGIMEAANKGHQEGRANHNLHSFGLNIRLAKGQIANKHLDVKKEFALFSRRLDFFMSLTHVIVVAAGGVGTLLELLYAWQLIQVKQISHIHIILLDGMWGSFMKWIKKWPLKHRLISKKDLTCIHLARTPDDAIKLIRRAHWRYHSHELKDKRQ